MFELFLTFAKIGVMTFGGGVAMLPMLQKEVVERRGWATEEEMIDYFAIGQCTPGIIAVNCATFIGYKRKGVAGGIVATLGMVFPSLVIIMVLAGLITNFSQIPAVKSAFAGIRVCVCVLVINATVKLYRKAVLDKATFAIFLLTALGSFFLKLSPAVFVFISALAGLLLKNLQEKRRGKERDNQ